MPLWHFAFRGQSSPKHQPSAAWTSLHFSRNLHTRHNTSSLTSSLNTGEPMTLAVTLEGRHWPEDYGQQKQQPEAHCTRRILWVQLERVTVTMKVLGVKLTTRLSRLGLNPDCFVLTAVCLSVLQELDQLPVTIMCFKNVSKECRTIIEV